MFDVRVATFGMSDVMVIFALPNASVAYAPNVTRCSVSRAICALVVGVVVISMPPVALILIDVSALSVSVMFVMTELISNESPGATIPAQMLKSLMAIAPLCVCQMRQPQMYLQRRQKW